MFGPIGFPEIIIILVIVLIIFGAGKLPQIGEGIGKALKGFKKEVHESPPPEDPNAGQEPPVLVSTPQPEPGSQSAPPSSEGQASPPPSKPVDTTPANTPSVSGPEATPGTTAALLYTLGPQKPAAPQSPISSQAQSSEALPRVVPSAGYAFQVSPPQSRPTAPTKHPSVGQKPGGVSSQDMQSVGEGFGDALRTFRQAVADVRGTVEPPMKTIQNEMDAAQKEVEPFGKVATHMSAAQEDPPRFFSIPQR